jgi:predicted solute-binding protein
MELWGTEWELPVRLAAGIIRDIRDGVNLEKPTKKDLKKSQTFAVARVFIDQKAGDKDFWAARDRQNKEIDKFIANYK